MQVTKKQSTTAINSYTNITVNMLYKVSLYHITGIYTLHEDHRFITVD